MEDDAEDDMPVADDALAEGEQMEESRNYKKSGPWKFTLLWRSSGKPGRCSNADVIVVGD